MYNDYYYDSIKWKMIRFQSNVSQKLSIGQKIGLVLSLIAGLTFLFFFAITFFFVALGAGAIIFLSNLLFGRKRFRRQPSTPSAGPPPAGPKVYRRDSSRDDDIIDV